MCARSPEQARRRARAPSPEVRRYEGDFAAYRQEVLKLVRADK